MANFCIYCDDETGLELARLERAIGESVLSDIPLAIELLFVSEDEIRALNADTRGVDKVTDVLSFPTLDGIKDKPICGKEHPFENMHGDHIVEWSKGGRTVVENLQMVCHDCDKELTRTMFD